MVNPTPVRQRPAFGLSGEGVPDLRGVVLAGGDEAPAIGTEFRAVQGAGAGDGEQFFAGDGIPELRLATAAGEDAGGVRAEGDGLDQPRVLEFGRGSRRAPGCRWRRAGAVRPG